MGVYIKGMEMPKNSRNCPFTEIDDWNRRCIVKGKFEWHRDRLCDNCPLIEVPDHGRLIDADALIADDWFLMKIVNGVNCAWTESKKLKDVPTIIPADKDINVLNKEEGE